jgi:indole-3-glycerol phosphate synthase
MADILQQIAANKRREVEASKLVIPTEQLAELASEVSRRTNSLRASILNTPGGIIAEFKRRSPSRGGIAPLRSPAEVVAGYDIAGAAGCSILTDTCYFGGSLVDLAVARTVTSLPLLRKEFIVDEYQLYQARIIGADAVLLIASLLSNQQIAEYTDLAHSLSLDVLLEIHGEDQLDAVNSEIDLVGVNNRDLTTFTTSLQASTALADKLPITAVKIAESGIHSPTDIKALRQVGYDGFLIGEALMSSTDAQLTLKSFIDGND